MLRLPLAFFVKRDDGDIVSRFHSLEPIRHLIAEGLLLALIDGVLALGTLVLMIVISPLLAADGRVRRSCSTRCCASASTCRCSAAARTWFAPRRPAPRI